MEMILKINNLLILIFEKFFLLTERFNLIIIFITRHPSEKEGGKILKRGFDLAYIGLLLQKHFE